MKGRIFYAACFGFCAGVLWRSFFPFHTAAALLIGAGAVFLGIFFVLSKRNLGILACAFILASTIGIVQFAESDTPAPAAFESQVGEKISIDGTIVENPQNSAKNVHIVVEVTEEGATTDILLFAQKNPDYAYGQKLHITGKLEKPDNFMTDQGKEFDYVNYLKNDDILFVMQRPTITIVSDGGNALYRGLFWAGKKFDAAIDGAIPNPESSLMRGLILGERSSFGDDLRNAFIATGLIHIITVSGYNVTLVAGWIMKLLGFLPVFFANSAGMMAIIFFVIMTGGTQTAIRAGIMASLALFAGMIGRKYDVSRALAATAVIMVFISPRILAFDVSFELSFLATIAVIYLAPHIDRAFARIRWKSIREVVAMTIAAYAFVLPFILYKMGNWSLIALPANFAMLPAIPLTMIAGFAAGFAGLFLNAPAIFLGKIAYILLHYELSAIRFFAGLPFASITVSNFPLVLMVLIYGIFCYALFIPAEKTPAKILDRRMTVLLLAMILTLGAAAFFSFFR